MKSYREIAVSGTSSWESDRDSTDVGGPGLFGSLWRLRRGLGLILERTGVHSAILGVW